MSERTGRSRVGCVLQVLVGLGLAVALGCSGLVAGSYWAFFAGIGAPPEPMDRPVVIRGGTLWDGTEAEPRTGQLVVIEADRIACVGKDCGVPPHALVLEASGYFLTPGLIDLHVHVGALAAEDLQRNPLSLMWATLRHRPGVRRAFLEHGVTAIRSVGDDPMALNNQRTWLDEGVLGGPALYAAGPVFTAPGGHPVNQLEAQAPWLIAGSTRQVTDPDRARTRVHELLDLEMDGIKLVYDDVGGSLPKLDKAVLDAVVGEARGRGAWVAVHTGSDADVADAVAAGASTVEHGAVADLLTEPTLAALAEAEVVYVPTLAVGEALLPDRKGPMMANALRAHEAGVPVGVGSDTQGPDMAFGASTVREVLLLAEAGLPVLDALRGATSVAARALQLEGELGVLAAGARADLVWYAADPRVTPATLLEPVLVLHDGRLVVDRR